MASLWLIWLLATQVTVQSALPKPVGSVNDFAAVLDSGTNADLVALLRETEQRTSVEVAVVTVPSLDGRTIEEYAHQLFAAWGIGKRGLDNGVLILVAPTERKVRIEVGYGLEPVLPDGLAGSIIRNDFLPHFKSGEYSAGILQGARRVAEVVQRNQPLSVDDVTRLDQEAQLHPPALVIFLLVSIFVAPGAFAFGLGVGARAVFLALWGAFFGGIPLLIAVFVPSFGGSPWALGPMAVAVFAWGLTKGRSPGSTAAFQLRSRSGPDREGWSTNDHSASSGGGGSDSFGGGASGGGGATGSW